MLGSPYPFRSARVANRRSSVWLCLSLLPLWCLTTLDGAKAQTTSLEALKSEIYFGSNLGDGQTVSQQAWEEFLVQVIVPRFPAGLTIIDALGSGGIAAPLTRTRVLVLVHA